MRLLERQNACKYRLTDNLIGHDNPRYAILSHTWGRDTEEVDFEDMMAGSGRNKTGYNKIEFCGERAAGDNLKYFWVDRPQRSMVMRKSSAYFLIRGQTSMSKVGGMETRYKQQWREVA